MERFRAAVAQVRAIPRTPDAVDAVAAFATRARDEGARHVVCTVDARAREPVEWREEGED